MASAIIHLCVAKRINEKLKLPETSFFLGSIAPDLSKQIGETKIKSHFLNFSSEDSIPDCDAFVSKYRKYLDNPFELGYLIHLLTDKYWFRDYVYQYINRYDSSKSLTYSAIKHIIYDDYTKINQDLIDYYNLNLYMFSNEIPYPVSKIEEIPIDKLPILIEKMSIIIANMNTSKTIMFNVNEIILFIENCSQKIIEDLKNYCLIKEV